MKIGTTIKYLRENAGISRKELSEAIQVDVRTISYWENNINEPKASYVAKLSVFFGVSADYLLDIEKDGN